MFVYSSTDATTQVRHRLAVRTPPVLATRPAQLLVVREGEAASLDCSATAGEPRPRLVWARSEGAGNRAANEPSRSFATIEKTANRAFSLLKAPTSTFTLKKILFVTWEVKTPKAVFV